MTLTRLLAAAIVVCSALASAQTKAVSDLTASTSTPATQASSEPWKFISNQPADAAAEKSALDRLQIDKYKVFPSKTDAHTLLARPEADSGIFLSSLDGEAGSDSYCLKIRSYVVARDSKNSDSTHPVSYSTCQPASRYRLKTTELRSVPLER